MNQQTAQPGLFIGIDWADQKHDIYIIDRHGKGSLQGPRHRVKLTRAFYFAKYEVTVGQFRAFVEATGYSSEAEHDGIGRRGFDASTQRVETRKDGYTWNESGLSADRRGSGIVGESVRRPGVLHMAQQEGTVGVPSADGG